MRTIRTLDFSQAFAERSVVTIGNFDGVHRGHREIFRRVCSRAAATDATSVVITFDPHPLFVLAPERAPLQITTFRQKQDLIAESGIDLLLVIPFNEPFSQMPAETFVRELLVDCLGLRSLVIGHDYAFGRNREGNEQLLARLGNLLGFDLEALDPVGDGSLVFSSSEVRRLVREGDVAAAITLLGRCHRISGTVVHGREIGRSLGFPTANISTDNRLIPSDGVYAVWVEAHGELHMGACSIGVNPTFEGGAGTIEVFLFDFSGDLYDQELTIHFGGRLRDVVRFSGAAALMEQISRDVAAARTMLSAGLPIRCSR